MPVFTALGVYQFCTIRSVNSCAASDFVSNKKFVFLVFSSHASRTEDLITLITLIKWPGNSPDLNPRECLVLDENSAPGEDHVHHGRPEGDQDPVVHKDGQYRLSEEAVRQHAQEAGRGVGEGGWNHQILELFKQLLKIKY